MAVGGMSERWGRCFSTELRYAKRAAFRLPKEPYFIDTAPAALQSDVDHPTKRPTKTCATQLARAQHGVSVEDEAIFDATNCSIKLTGHLAGHGVAVSGQAQTQLTECFLRRNRHAIFAADRYTHKPTPTHPHTHTHTLTHT